MVILDKGYVGRTCSVWLRECGQMLVKKINGRYLIDAICSGIRDAVDSRCQSVLQDVLSFLESPKAALRLKGLAAYVQNKCYEIMSTILTQLKREIDNLYAAMENANKEGRPVPPAITVERSLFIGRLLFAFRNHSKHIPVILGSPRFWVGTTRGVATRHFNS